MSKFIESIRKLVRDASLYADLLTVQKGELKASIELTDTGETATLTLVNKIKVIEGSINPDFKISMTSKTFKEITRGKADAFALAGRSRSDEVRPIEFEVYSKERSKEIWETIKAMLTYLFTPGRVKIKKLHGELAGQAHGAHPIPLVYWDGLRYSWFIIKSGETLNKEGERDPWPQMFIPLRGKGKAIVANVEFEIKPNTAIYIPRNCLHKIIADKDVELLWLAWQAE